MRFDRREFLGASLSGCAGLSVGSLLARPSFGSDSKPEKQAAQPLKAEGPSTLFLTWQRDPTTTITIQWVGPEKGSGLPIEFRPEDSPVWRAARTLAKPFPETDLKISRCELTGLTPEIEYRFRIGGKGFEHRFRTLPAKATNEFCFVSGGDSGVGEHALANNQLAARQDPYFVLMAGDLAYDNGKSPKTVIQFLENYRSSMLDSQGRMIPLISCLGNHEVKGSYGQPREHATHYLPLFDGLYEHTTFGVLDIGDYLSLILLDTGHVSPVAGEQTEWLQRTLAAREDRAHVIAANHVPAYPSYRDPNGKDTDLGVGAAQRKHWSPLFERYKIDAVLEHHDHAFKRTHPLTNGLYDKYGVVYLGDGSWGKIRPPKPPVERPYLAKSSEAYHITLHCLQGDQRFHIALQDNGKIADVTSTLSKRPSRRG